MSTNIKIIDKKAKDFVNSIKKDDKLFDFKSALKRFKKTINQNKESLLK